MGTFLDALKEEGNKTLTENGALTHKSTMDDLVDFFYHGAALRNESDEKRIVNLFSKAFSQDRLLALKVLFYIRDIRGGQGERRVFRVITQWLGLNYPEILINNISNFVEFGRWDDLIELIINPDLRESIIGFIKKEIDTREPSLLAKWLPAINATSKHTKQLAKIVCQELFDGNQRSYRKFLVQYRTQIPMVEREMSTNNWSKIKYSSVPSRASMIYRDAFKKHDEERYNSFLEKVEDGTEKINTGTLYPYDIVKKYLEYSSDNNKTLNALWDNLPNYCDTEDNLNSIVVADVSGSMTCDDGLPMAVSVSLAMYFAERIDGVFNNHFITFSGQPDLVEIKGENLFEKVHNISRADWSMNTNLQAVFDLILNTGNANKTLQKDMPNRIFIVSDMEFDECVSGNSNYETLKAEYKAFGYEIPKIVFWNVNSRNNQTPITTKDDNTFLVSGCNPSIFKNIMNSKASSALDLILEVLNQERYSTVVV